MTLILEILFFCLSQGQRKSIEEEEEEETEAHDFDQHYEEKEENSDAEISKDDAGRTCTSPCTVFKSL